MESVLVAFMSFGLGPTLVVSVGWYLNRLGDKRAAKVKAALDETSLSNTLDHSAVVNTLEALKQEIREHRAEFSEYRSEHAREHQLINRILH